MSDEIKTEEQKRIERMDRVAETLLLLVESDNTTEAQKGRLFNQVMQWYKMRGTLTPPDDGGKLKEMSNALKSKGYKRGGSAGKRGPRGPYKTKDGRAIQKLIKSLPGYGGGVGGNQENPERSGGGTDGDDLGISLDGGGDGDGDVDVSGNSSIV